MSEMLYSLCETALVLSGLVVVIATRSSIKPIGGSSRSQHCKGQALDLQYWSGGKMDNKKIYDYILDNDIEFDQMINEFDFSWIHISYSETKNRKQVLEAYKDKDNKTAYRHAKDNIRAL